MVVLVRSRWSLTSYSLLTLAHSVRSREQIFAGPAASANEVSASEDASKKVRF